jgi:hypothetical protein
MPPPLVRRPRRFNDRKQASIAREQKAHKLPEMVDCMIADRGLTRQ